MKKIKHNKIYTFGIITFFFAILFMFFGFVSYFAEILINDNVFLNFSFEKNSMILFFIVIATSLFLVSNLILFQEYNKIYMKKNVENNVLKNNKSENLNHEELSNIIFSLKEIEDLQKNTRQNVFNLMLDTNGINSPDDMQSALEKIENSLIYLKNILDKLKIN